MRTVRRYLALQQRLDPMAQLDALRAALARGRDDQDRVLNATERADITDHLASLSQWKPTAYLLEAFQRVERGETVQLRPGAANQEGGDIDEIAALLLGEPPAEAPVENERVRRAILDALAKGHHPAAQPLFERLAEAPDARPSDQAFALRFFAANGQYPRAYRWIEHNLMNLLLRVEPNDQQFLIQAVADVQRGDSDEDGRARWRTDPHAAATWPELALSLYWYQIHSFGADRALAFQDAVGSIALTDFGARPARTHAPAMC